MSIHIRITLVLLCTFIFAFAYFRSQPEPLKSYGERTNVALDWQANRLVLKSYVTIDSGLREPARLPAELRPVFFAKIPVNKASLELLITVPGIGPRTAEEIIRLRTERKRINTIEELLSIRGIGQKKMNILQEYLSFE